MFSLNFRNLSKRANYNIRLDGLQKNLQIREDKEFKTKNEVLIRSKWCLLNDFKRISQRFFRMGSVENSIERERTVNLFLFNPQKKTSENTALKEE
jgi:hypothetical protein